MFVLVFVAVGCGDQQHDPSAAPVSPPLSVTDAGGAGAAASSTLASSDAGAPPLDAGGRVATPPSAASAALVAARPYAFRAPVGYDPSRPTPLVIALHGFADWGAKIDGYFGLGALVDSKGFLYAFPDGSVDLSGHRFWNATDACCNLTFRPVDDVAYLNAVLDDIEWKYNVDEKRVFVVGHSNGGFMAHRFACDAASRVAAIVSLGGAQWFDASKCKPTTAVSVAEVHGDADQTIHYDGGFAASLYPSAHQTVATWAAKDGCTGGLTSTGTMLDIDTAIAGTETRVERTSGCPGNVGVELWTVQGGPHIPPLAQPTWPELVYAFLSSHPKP